MIYINFNWSTVLLENKYRDFSDIWQKDLPLVDTGNFGRGGYSLVSRASLHLSNGSIENIYIKRQQNYICFSWYHPLRGIPTLQREFINWQICQRLQIATYEVLYFATRRENNNLQAILMTRALSALPLEEWIMQNPSPSKRFAVTRSLARLIKKLHSLGYAHGHLVPAHIFVDEHLRVYFIDLEKMHRIYFGHFSFKKDLAKLNRHLPKVCTRSDRLRFWLEYKKDSKN